MNSLAVQARKPQLFWRISGWLCHMTEHTPNTPVVGSNMKYVRARGGKSGNDLITHNSTSKSIISDPLHAKLNSPDLSTDLTAD